MTNEIGEKLKSISDDMQNEIYRLQRQRKELNSAWTDWDYEYLLSNGYITQKEADQIKEEFHNSEL